MKYRGI